MFDFIFKKLNLFRKPEDEFVVTLTDEFVRVEHPKRKTEEILWKEIDEIRLINTDAGPFQPDIWLVLIGENGGCSIPNGSEGYSRVYDIVSEYDNFDFMNVILSMSTAENREFQLWKRQGSASR
ncbi:hypothetical protein EHQ12_01475 [Leptospira gomenensis]|uniref:Uncharacterized protein n=1 Tax=Leptospira gomenensis TaxID=2484974 RepID=A0A5F1YJH4_9LEPT|nr:hypothetical protein [Leptospira gomenensis]TGK34484.1 hypothetical protein EHQ17_08640 [Leptospira gomenensis]TGK40206.1 hypothetical protein EHQ07_19260 [Leptospira gomenensis]TGK44807.1 hypothetical protein EHQ12_01475 [Leptospira gomenensis]TGK55715.1 hypothetical protein EHQ13_17485 [Leptospira gomenensis]